MKQAYLAGAMFGLVDRGQTWREQLVGNMPPGWRAINPNIVEINKVCPRDIVAGDYAAILASQAVIAKVSEPSWGTAMELSFAWQHGIPVLGFDAPSPCSPWLKAHTTMLGTLAEVLEELSVI